MKNIFKIPAIFCLLNLLIAASLQAQSGNPSVMNVSVGGFHGAVLKTDGSIWSFGFNGNGQLGDGTTAVRATPVLINAPGDTVQVACSANHTMALSRNGELWAWGANDRGQLGDGTWVGKLTRVRVGTALYKGIAAGAFHSIGIAPNNVVYTWGRNNEGQLGRAPVSEGSNTPLPVRLASNNNETLGDVAWVSSGMYHSFAIDKNGTWWGWGANINGELGDGTNNPRPYAIPLPHLNGFISVVGGGGFSIGLKSDGTVWVWGLNAAGQLGLGDTTNRFTPVQLPGVTNVAAIAAGWHGGMALKNDRTVWDWGYFWLSPNPSPAAHPPVQVPGLSNIVSIFANGEVRVALKADGTFWNWGNSYYGQLGNGTVGTFQLTAAELVAFRDPAGNPSTAFARTPAGSKGSFNNVLKSDGNLWSWGHNSEGQLNDGSNVNRLTAMMPGIADGFIASSSGTFHTLLLKKDGTVWAWGADDYGQLGDGGGISKFVPVQVKGVYDCVAVCAGSRHSLALKRNGQVWAWGSNTGSQLGVGSTAPQVTIPRFIPYLDNVKALRAGLYHNLAIRNDGSVWGWGANSFGELGLGHNNVPTYPVPVPALSGMTDIACGGGFSVGLKSNGSVWSWGLNQLGQLGNGSGATVQTTPNLISGLNSITAIACGGDHALALRSDGTVRAWGYNAYGQVGDGSTTTRAVPVTVTGLGNVASIATGLSHSLAIKNDGTYWAWGQNNMGQLGDGTVVNRTLPVQVSGINDPQRFTTFDDCSQAITPPNNANPANTLGRSVSNITRTEVIENPGNHDGDVYRYKKWSGTGSGFITYNRARISDFRVKAWRLIHQGQPVLQCNFAVSYDNVNWTPALPTLFSDELNVNEWHRQTYQFRDLDAPYFRIELPIAGPDVWNPQIAEVEYHYYQ